MPSTRGDDPRRLNVELDLASTAEPFRGARIVIVDDDVSNVQLLCTVLSMAGATDLHGFTDPRQAVRMCLEQHPDLLLLDLHMGQVDGYDVLHALRPATSATEVLPVLVLSGDTTAEARRRSLEAGATGFISKPFDLVELVRQVRAVLEARARHQVPLAAWRAPSPPPMR